jgi:hypothetical protein
MANTRIELAMEKGDKIELKCKKCSQVNKYHVNLIYANKNKLVELFALSILIIGTIVILKIIFAYVWETSNIYGIGLGLILIPVTIYSIIVSRNGKRISNFNTFKKNE